MIIKRKILIVLGVLMMVGMAVGLAAAPEKADETFPAAIAIECPTGMIPRLMERYPVDLVKGNQIFLFMTRSEYDRLLTEFVEYTRSGQLKITITQTNADMQKNLAERDAYGRGYHTYDTLLAELQSLQNSKPTLCKLTEIASVAGNSTLKVWGFKISDNVATEEDEPCTFLCGGIHGNEKPGPEVVMTVINHLLTNYGTDQAITDLVNNTQFWFIPIVNPYGHQNNVRTNYNGVDLNRNWPTSWTYGERMESEVTGITTNFFPPHHFVAGVDYHTYGQLTMYPWASTSTSASDVNALKELSDQMASNSGHQSGTINQFMGTVSGSSCDWQYGKYGIFSMAVELGTSYAPPVTTMEQICQTELASALMVLKRVHKSTVTGIITDAQSNQPVVAQIVVTGVDKTTGDKRLPYKSDPTYGRYYRILKAGTYTLTFSANGFTSQTQQVVINSTSQTVLNISLVPTGGVSKEIFTGSFAGAGLWSYDPNTSAWAQWNATDASQLAVGDFDGNGAEDIIGCYNAGLWIRLNTGTWQKVDGVSNPDCLAAGDVNGDGKADVVGVWSGIGVWARYSISNTWAKILDKDANQVTCGDFDQDGKAEILGWWSPEGLWTYDPADATWSKILDEANLLQIASGDMNGDSRADVLGIWTHGCWCYNPSTGAWNKLYDPATKIAAANLNGMNGDDLIGTWASVPGTWVRYDDGTWYKIHNNSATSFSGGKLK